MAAEALLGYRVFVIDPKGCLRQLFVEEVPDIQ